MTDPDEDIRSRVPRILNRRFKALARASGLPLVFGGAVAGGPRSAARRLVLTEFCGVHSGALAGIEVRTCVGLGGRALGFGTPQVVADYAASRFISHEYDEQVVEQERLASMFALPVVVGGRPIAVVYGASRAGPIGDVALKQGVALVDRIRQDYSAAVPAPAPVAPIRSGMDAVRAIDSLLRDIADPAVRHRLAAVRRYVGSGLGTTTADAPPLARREVEVLRLVALGRTNVEIARETGLAEQTVKSYLRNAMRKLDVRNRTAAVHVARAAGLL
jgi:LuxR family transcriptional regulator, regulator of acetate metabolism